MKAVYVEQTGPPEVLQYGDLPEPEPGPNEVLIRVRATSLNRLDLFMREGSHGTRITPPEILGRDMAGSDALEQDLGLPQADLVPLWNPEGELDQLTIQIGDARFKGHRHRHAVDLGQNVVT